MPTILVIQDMQISFEPNDIESVGFAAAAQILLARAATTKVEYEALKAANNIWFDAAMAAENKSSTSLALVSQASAAIHRELDALIRRW